MDWTATRTGRLFYLLLSVLLAAVAWGWGDQRTVAAQPEPAAESAAAQPTTVTTPETSAAEVPPTDVAWPLCILLIGVLVVLGLIIGLKVNAFIALITAAMVVSLLASGPLAEKIARVATAFGQSAGKIGIVIAMAAVIGKCMLDSGAADRIVRAFLRLFGERRAPAALMGSGFVLAIPVFFDTVFYLLVPLARSLHRRTKSHYLLYVLAIAAGGAITHTLVPPTPGPLVMADQLGFPFGIMIIVGAIVALPSAIAGLLFARLADRLMPVPMRAIGSDPEPTPLADSELPSLSLSLAPVILPVLLISADTLFPVIVSAVGASVAAGSWLATVGATIAIFGNANLALLLSAVIALLTLAVQRGLTRSELARVVEVALMSGGVIILITAGGGAFGAMLKEAQVGEAIKQVFAGAHAAGLMILLLGFGIAAVLKIAQGSSTVAMITGSAMLAGMASPDTLGFHPVYLATAIGSGSLFGSWMNDSGFWIFAKMSGLTEVEALKSWTIMLLVLAVTGLLMTILLVLLVPDPTFAVAAQGIAR